MSARFRRILVLLVVFGAIVLIGVKVIGRDSADDTERSAEVNKAGESEDVPAFSSAELDSLRRPIEAAIEAGAFPGAAMAVGRGADEWHLLAMGAIGWTRNAPAVDAEATRYDLASVTKVVATATAVLLLLDEGKLSLDDPVARFFPEFEEGPKASVTIRHLLTHTSGLPEGATLEGRDRAQRIQRAKNFRIFPPAGAHVGYSDVGFILLWEIAGMAAGEPLTNYLDRKLFQPLGMSSTGFSPGLDCEPCAPTGRLRDQSLYRGKPFDPLAQRLDGVTGSAGLFSSAGDLARFVAMVANGGVLDGVRVLSEAAASEFIREQPVAGSYRLGWEALCPDSHSADELCPAPDAVRHTGWTGASIHLDPATGAWLVLLTNRTYEPKAENPLRELRRLTFTNVLGFAGPGDSLQESVSTVNPATR